MARFRGGNKSRSGKRKALYNSVKRRQNAKRKSLLPGRGITQKSYETGFFDFLNVFWSNNLEMELCSLTKQVANAWDTLLPKPKHSKRVVMKNYSKEYKMLQEEARMQKEEQEQNEIKEKHESDQNIDNGTKASVRRNIDDEKSEKSIQSKGEVDDDRTESDVDERLSSTDESMSENRSEKDSESEYESDDNTERRSTRVKRKRNGRKYGSYEEYLNARGKKIKQDKDDAGRSEGNGNDQNKSGKNKNSGTDQNKEENKSLKEDIVFPIREPTSFDRLVRTEFEDQNEMLRKLKLYGSNTDPCVPDDDDMKEVRSDGSFSLPLAGPKLSPNRGNTSPYTAKLTSPTDTLHVKNLVVGIRQPELQDIFQIFLKDINDIRVLDNEFNGEAVIEFKTVEAAENVWRQMNGVEYKRLPLVLEFANREDLRTEYIM